MAPVNDSGGSNVMSSRLSNSLTPKHYDVRYKTINLDQFRFEGVVIIDCTASQDLTDSTSIVIHALELEILKATLRSREERNEAVEVRLNRIHQTCEIYFERALNLQKEQEFTLSIEFLGCLNNQMRGLYRSSYQGLDGENYTMATTQFEPTDARRAFPCFDEPAMKATFSLTVTIPAHLQCLSNTPMASTHTCFENGKFHTTITFQKTPKMSTYLVALVVGTFDGISRTSNQIVTTVYTVPGKAHMAEFCLDTAVRCLDLYQELFQIPYPLVKSDLVAIPDFAAGAMENWGLVTYREAKVLIQANATSESTRRGVARTLCHELAHQWFGNLVTPEFWTQLWLKEGAARFFEFVAVDKLFPEWNAWDEFVQSVFGLALGLDSMNSSHPVEVEVHHPDEINEIFDAISYAKGASIIRMIASLIGMESFFQGMRIYLKRHAYANAVTNDVWGALEEASGFPVVKFMQPWTLDVGFPILEIGDSGGIQMSRFLASGRQESQAARWPVPVTAIVEGLDIEQGPWVLNGPQGDEHDALREKIVEWTSLGKWFKLNAHQTGFFRVSYTSNQWKRLTPALIPNGHLSTSDRLGLISDAFSTGKAGYCSIVCALELVAGFGSHEVAEYAVWQELSEHLSGLTSLFRSEAWFPLLQTFLRNIYSRQMETLGWDAKPGEAPRVGTLRATVLGMMSKSGDPIIAREAFERLMAYEQNSTEAFIPGDMQEALFRCALKHDEATAFEALLSIYERAALPEEKRNTLSSLGCVKDPKRHADLLDYVFFSGKVRLQDVCFPLGSLSGSTDDGGRATWLYFKSNFARLHQLLGSGPMWASCVGLCCRGLRTTDDVADVERFFSDPVSPAGSALRRLTQAIEFVNVQINRRDRDRASVEEFLRSQQSG